MFYRGFSWIRGRNAGWGLLLLLGIAAAVVWLVGPRGVALTSSVPAQEAAVADGDTEAPAADSAAEETAATPQIDASERTAAGSADEPSASGDEATPSRTDAAPRDASRLPPPEGAERLSPQYDVWIDPKEGVVLIDGQISLREGWLEMFACTRNTKEHESIVSANTRAFIVHAALLRLGAEPGTPVRFLPEYQPPTGTEIEVLVQWVDEEGNEQTDRAQEWVRNVHTNKAMTHPFVFAGSGFWTDPETGRQHYQAEGGDFICVSNFGTAMLDIPVESSQTNDELAFQANTEAIPPLGAPVRLILRPQLDKPAGGARTATDRVAAPRSGESTAAARRASSEGLAEPGQAAGHAPESTLEPTPEP